MKVMTTISLTLLSATLLLANPYQNKEENRAEILKIGNEVSVDLLKTLGKNLKGHMQKGGPIDAAQFCSTSALSITDDISNKYGKEITVKRISLKYRSPVNKPSASEQVVLDSLESLNANGVELPKFLLQENGATIKYYKPLSINKGVCLKCHGTVNNPKLKKYLSDTYPEDKAMGYKMGDLRGAVVVEIKR